MDINDNAVSLLVGFIIPWNRSDPRRTQHRKSNATVTLWTIGANTVLFATVLFFAGTAGKFDRLRMRRSTLAFAIAVFDYAAVLMIILPVA